MVFSEKMINFRTQKHVLNEKITFIKNGFEEKKEINFVVDKKKGYMRKKAFPNDILTEEKIS